MHDSLIATKHCSSAGLVSRKDGKIRGCTATFKLEDFEIKAVSMAFKDVTLARGVRQLTTLISMSHTCEGLVHDAPTRGHARLYTWCMRVLQQLLPPKIFELYI